VLNGRITDEITWKGFARKLLQPEVKSWHLPEGTEENHENLTLNSWCLGWDSN
jgi:hypothetical protein